MLTRVCSQVVRSPLSLRNKPAACAIFLTVFLIACSSRSCWFVRVLEFELVFGWEGGCVSCFCGCSLPVCVCAVVVDVVECSFRAFFMLFLVCRVSFSSSLCWIDSFRHCCGSFGCFRSTRVASTRTTRIEPRTIVRKLFRAWKGGARPLSREMGTRTTSLRRTTRKQ